MKIDKKLIDKIFNGKILLKNKTDKMKLSEYTEYIPMYDIYSDSIYPIENINLYYRLVNCHYRFINDEVKQWLINKKLKIEDTILIEKYNKNLSIIDNYILDTLEKTSYETLYRFSPDLGLTISICKRNSFNPYSYHLTPYYTKNELIKLGMNNKIIKNIDTLNLMDKSLHYKICKKVSKNDISSNTIIYHMKEIISNKCIGWVVYYSLIGSYIFNKILRENLSIPRFLYDGMQKIIDTMNMVDLPKDYFFYRFVWDDKYIKDLKIGGVFIDRGFISTTRDPFYSPGIKMDFGLILIRINVPKHLKGVGLLIENFSMFPKEEEFLLQPLVKLKLVARENTSYFHINEKFEKLIKKKYEFDLISIDNKISKEIKIDDDIVNLNINTMELNGNTRTDLFKLFIDKTDNMGFFNYKDNIYNVTWFDSLFSYQHMYYNKTKDGIIITNMIDGNINISIECGEKLVVNYSKTKCYYDNMTETELLYNIDDITAMFCKLFKYNEAYIFFEYNNFSKFSENYKNDSNEYSNEYLYNNMYCNTLYQYVKNNIKLSNKYYKYEYGFWQIDNIMKTLVPIEILNKLPTNMIKNKLSWGTMFIEVIENYFYLYHRMEEWFNTYFDNIFKNVFYTFNANLYLKSMDYNIINLPDFKHVSTSDRGQMFEMIYRNTERRI